MRRQTPFRSIWLPQSNLWRIRNRVKVDTEVPKAEIVTAGNVWVPAGQMPAKR